MSLFLAVAMALVCGLLFTRITQKFHLPDVTAYLVAGVLIGPYGLGLLGIDGIGFTSTGMVEEVSFLGDLALGFIAFEIGNEFRLEELKKTGRQALIVGVLQAVITTLLVDVVLVGLALTIAGDKLSIPAAITLGAIAAATAPAATLMVIKQYKAKGKVTDILLPVVALDDAVGLAL
ncbi:MAG: cation:proton antiporter, partial [Firmicutes bacterium]|nr:cation:proton antiporter [Bacillota bacterium]